MTVFSTAPAANTRAAGPSLYKLVSGLPDERRLRQPADALVIIGRQLELVVQDQGLAADVVIGTLRFSLFRLHQGRIAQLAPHCRSITIYGEADVEPPMMPGVEFVPLPPGSPLSQEWFLIIESPFFWGALITQAVPERTSGVARRYLFDGALTADERVVSRANLLLSLVRRQPAPDVGTRYALANRAHWALVAQNLSAHSEAERLSLPQSLSEIPELIEVAALRDRPLDQVISGTMEILSRRVNTVGQILYRCEGLQLTPVSWSGDRRPAPADRHSGLVGRALDENTPVMIALGPSDPERQQLLAAQSALAVPLLVHDQPWGVLLIGQHEADPNDSPTTIGVIGVAALLEQILVAKLPHNGARPSAPLPAADITPSAVAPRVPAPSFAPPGSSFAPPTAGAPPTRDVGPPTPGFSPPAPSFGPPAAGFAPPTVSLPPAPPAPTWEATLTPPPAAPNWDPYPSAAPAYTPPAPPAYTPPPPAPPAPIGPRSAPPASNGGGFGLPSWLRASAPPPARSLPGAPTAPSSFPSTTEVQTERSFSVLQKRLMGALVAFDQRTAEQIWSEAGGLYSTEALCTDLLMPVQIAVGEGWHRGEVSVAAEHFCSRFVEGKLLNLLNAYVDSAGGPLAIIGCAQAEMHELGAIMLSLFMKWAGFRVIYLGQNVPNSTIDETVRQLRPHVLGLSATTIEAAHNLTETGQILARIEPPRPHFIFGGMAFYERPDLRGRIQGQFLEGDVRKIVRDLAAQLKK